MSTPDVRCIALGCAAVLARLRSSDHVAWPARRAACDLRILQMRCMLSHVLRGACAVQHAWCNNMARRH
eukprot:15437359-Alexandrium_andersonii.AAC.1